MPLTPHQEGLLLQQSPENRMTSIPSMVAAGMITEEQARELRKAILKELSAALVTEKET